MNEQIIYRYLSDRATEEEQQALLAWLNESDANKDIFFELKAIWHTGKFLVPDDDEKKKADLLAKLNTRINAIEGAKKTKHLYTKWACAAAIFLLVAVSSYWYLYSPAPPENKQYYTYTNYTTSDSILNVTLPDGTLVWLADSSTLEYPKYFCNGKRIVRLSGVAFFDVSEDKEHPFIVRTDMADVIVTGTSFSVNTRMPGEACETLLMTGSVELKCGNEKETVTLSPGQQALYSMQSGTLEINEVDVNRLTSWRYGIVSLSDVSMSEIVKKLEEIYHIQVQIDIFSLKTNRYNFSFKPALGSRKAVEQLSEITGLPAEVIEL